MSNTEPVRQLKELFPHVARDFLQGLCDGYRSDELDINEMVEVVLGFEFPPLDIEFIQNIKNNDTSSGESTCQSSDKVTVAVGTTNLQVLHAQPVIESSIVDSRPTETPNDNIGLDSDDDAFTTALNSREPSVESKTTINVQQINAQSSLSEESDDESLASEKDYSKSLRLLFEDDSFVVSKVEWGMDESPEKTLPLLVGTEIQNLPLNVSDQPEEFAEEVFYNCVTESLVKEFPEIKTENEYLLGNANCNNGPCSSKVLETKHKIKIRRSSSFNSGSPQSPRTPCAKRPSFRSCKVKNDEQRLRSKLLRLNRLSNKISKEKMPSSEEESDTGKEFGSSNARLSLLTKILPDAEVDYLSDQSQKVVSAEEMLTFISRALDGREYPRAQQEQSKTMERFECTVRDFLQVIPEPNAEFSSDHYIRNGYEGNAEIYLQSRYQSLGKDEIVSMLKAYNYNMTRMTAELEAQGVEPGPYCLDTCTMHHEPCVFFHQEVWFIEHRRDIQGYLDSVLEAVKVEEELNRPPTPPPVEEVFECDICREEVLEYTELRTCDGPNGHLFCKHCVRRSVEVGFADAQTTFPCLHKHNCTGYIPLPTVKEVLPAPMFEKLMDNIHVAQVKEANIPGIETCPFCPYAYGPDLADVFVCSNPVCRKLSCRICKKEDHSPQQCEMFREENEETARHFIEERMTEALIRSCTRCDKKFVKEAGCNKMTCQCGALMCYVCRKPVKDYTHFNGPGGDHTERCPLFTDDAFVHDQPVQNTAQRALEQLLANNPGAGLDPTRLLPRH